MVAFTDRMVSADRRSRAWRRRKRQPVRKDEMETFETEGGIIKLDAAESRMRGSNQSGLSRLDFEIGVDIAMKPMAANLR